MPNPELDQIELNNTTYDIKDTAARNSAAAAAAAATAAASAAAQKFSTTQDGIVNMSGSGGAGKYLRGDNTWQTLIDAEQLEQLSEDVETAIRTAEAAQQAAEDAADLAETYADQMDVTAIWAAINEKGDNLWFNTEDNKLYLMSNGEPIGDGVVISGGGGGGGGTEFTITLTNLMADRMFTIAYGTSLVLSYSYTSLDTNNYDDGPGIGTLLVNNVAKATFSVPQGNNTIDVSPYLDEGTNTVKIRVTNSESSSKSLTYTVNAVALSVSTTFATLASYSGDVLFSYTPSGVGEKTIHFVMDGTQIGTAVVNVNNRSQTYTITERAHGGHIFECYATMTVDNVSVTSNTLRLGMMWVDPNSNVPIIFTPFNKTTAVQGETLIFDYMAYDPSTQSASVTRTIKNPDQSTYAATTVSVDRSPQSWSAIDYPVGSVSFVLSCAGVSVTKTVTVSASTIIINPITDNLLLEFTAQGRSNNVPNPGQWSYGNYTATFTGFGWTTADGWLEDEDHATVLRFLPEDYMSIPFKPFESDIRSSGITIEAELRTRDVQDYDSIVVSSYNNGRGFRIGSQYATIKSEQSEVTMQFKEDSRIRVCFSVENRNQNRFVYIYINGIMCGITQYPADDNFAQTVPDGIHIGAESCGIDLYRIRIYGKGLDRNEQLDNFIYDRPTLALREAAYRRNDILNASEEIVPNKIPATLPYMIIECPELPQYKGDKKTGVSITYVNAADNSKSFTATGVEMDVQGTSSAGYPVKNFKIKFKNGFRYTLGGQTSSKYQIKPNSVPVSTFCYKADFASSEGANNVKLVDLYNSACPYKTPPVVADPRCRQGIDGIPIVIFWTDTVNNTTEFVGKYNFNNDKSNEDVFGFDQETYPLVQSWEFLNNTSNRTLFKASDYSDGWLQDFEARFPEESETFTQLKRCTDWVVSTDRDAVVSAEDKAARLAKFHDEFTDYFVKDAMLFYYLFTEVFLMIDSRAKNMFLSTYDGTHWLPLPYDMDTAIGINNEGVLSFNYDLEDTDTIGGANVFNGQTSVLWCNVRDAFADDLANMYKTLRSGQIFNYAYVRDMFLNHQSVWPEALWNEDAYKKYIAPYLDANENYLSMLQGNKESQRDWWLFNAFKYRDSKYHCGDALANFITLRAYAKANITLTPYSDIWVAIKYGSYLVRQRGHRNQQYTLVNPVDDMNDTEVYIYSADRMSDVGDLSPLKVGYANFSMALKLQSLKLGDSSQSYSNTTLKELYVGSNELLKTIDIRNCEALGTDTQKSIDLSGCTSLEEVYASGTAVSSFVLPNGGHLTTLDLPNTITNLTILNQKDLTTCTFTPVVGGYNNISTLRIENTPNVPLEGILYSGTSLERVRLINVEWTSTSEATLQTIINRLKSSSIIGMDAEGNNTAKAVVTGKVHVSSISANLLDTINTEFPELIVVINGVPQYMITYVNYDYTVLYKAVVAEGGNAINPVTTGAIQTPAKPGTYNIQYEFNGFGTLPTNVHQNYTLVAQYDTYYLVEFLNWDVSLVTSQYVIAGGNAVAPSPNPTRPPTNTQVFTFTGWDHSLTNVQESFATLAQYSSATRTYRVRFYNGSTLLQTVYVEYQQDATYTGTTPTHTDPLDPDATYAFTGWSPSNQNITADTDCIAQFVNTSNNLSRYLEGTLRIVENSSVTTIGEYAFRTDTVIMSISFPNATTVSAHGFRGCTALTTVGLPNVTSVGEYAFYDCTALTSITLDKLELLPNYTFGRCSSLQSISLPKLWRIARTASASYSPFYRIHADSTIILGDYSGDISFSNTNTDYTFSSNNLTGATVYLRSNSVPNTNSSTAVNGIAVLYVKSSLVSTFQAANGWSKITSIQADPGT